MMHSKEQNFPGHRVTERELHTLGFYPYELEIYSVDVQLPEGVGYNWKTIGDVPELPGVYAFTVDDYGSDPHVTYVGQTKHLWMVTKGRLPRLGGARGPQRYGRPLHAGETRRRINILASEQIRKGYHVRHWLRPTDASLLLTDEEELIRRWNLRRVGWNRG